MLNATLVLAQLRRDRHRYPLRVEPLNGSDLDATTRQELRQIASPPCRIRGAFACATGFGARIRRRFAWFTAPPLIRVIGTGLANEGNAVRG